jgi:hypothetical protein
MKTINNIFSKNYLIFALVWLVLIPFYELAGSESEIIIINDFVVLALILLFPACAIAHLVFSNKLNWGMAKQWGMLSILFLLFPVVLVIIRCFLGIPDLDFHPESEAGMDYFFETMNYLIGVLVDKSQILETLTMWAFLQPILCLPLFLFLHLVRKILLFSKFAGKIPVRSIKPESIFQTIGWIFLGILPFVWLINIAEIFERFD